ERSTSRSGTSLSTRNCSNGLTPPDYVRSSPSIAPLTVMGATSTTFLTSLGPRRTPSANCSMGSRAVIMRGRRPGQRASISFRCRAPDSKCRRVAFTVPKTTRGKPDRAGPENDRPLRLPDQPRLDALDLVHCFLRDSERLEEHADGGQLARQFHQVARLLDVVFGQEAVQPLDSSFRV